MSPSAVNYKIRWTWWVFLIASVMAVFVDGLHVSVDALGAKRGLIHFWSSTGFSPPGGGQVAQDFLSSESVTRNLDVIGAVPNTAIRQLRVHWLLELIKPVRSEKSFTWNYDLLDSFLDRVMKSGLRPRFELMGNPGGMFTDFSDEGHQAEMWMTLITSIAIRYALRYGPKEVSKWSFETWNEPDLRQYNTINMTLPAYLSYFRETVSGLRRAEELVAGLRLSLSGPAGLFKRKDKHPLCWGLLEYCNRMAKENKSCGLSEITFHHKGESSVQEILTGGLTLAEVLNKEMPFLNDIPMSNDEADPISGWWRPLSWREDVRMAAMIVKSVAIHMDWVLKGKPRGFNLLGGDHGFLAQPPNFFNQRTLLARFPIDESNEQVFRKPSLGAMLLLGLLGNRKVEADVTGTDKRVSVLATSSIKRARKYDWTVEVLLCLCDDTKQNSSQKMTVNVAIRGLQSRYSGAKYRVLQLSATLPHPASIWDLAGRPEKPDATMRALMRAAEGPHLLKQLPLSTDTLEVSISLPSVTLLQVCGPTRTLPGRVTGLRAVNVTFNEVLILFGDRLVKSKCITTFQVEFCKRATGTKSECVVLEGRNMYLAYHYAPQSSKGDVEDVRGRYRVRAVDVWSRPGPYSKPIDY